MEETMKKSQTSITVLSLSLLLALLLGVGTFLVTPAPTHAQGLLPTSLSTLSAPTLKLPKNKSSLNDTTPYFKWTMVTGAVKYQLVVDNNVSFGSPILNLTNITTTWYTMTSPLPQTTYYWRVRAMDNKGNWGRWSYIFRFTIDTVAPGVPVLLAPLNGAVTYDRTTTFYWKAVTGAEKYQLYLSETADFADPYFTTYFLEPTAYNFLFAIEPGTYYWKVRARDAAGNIGGWSVVWKVIIRK
jgi:hypothetical protein